MEMYIALDLETTGVDKKKDKIIEFGAAKYNEKGEITDKLEILINPEMKLPAISEYITHITDADLKDAPVWEDKVDEIQKFIGNSEIVGHNVQFDIGFLEENGITLAQKSHDTCDLASIFIPEANSYSLEVLSHQLNITHERKHRALDDAIASMDVLFYVLQQKEKLNENEKKTVNEILKKSLWESKELFSAFDMSAINKKKYKFDKFTTEEIEVSEKNKKNFTNIIKLIEENDDENLLIENKIDANEFLKYCKKNLNKNYTVAISKPDFQALNKSQTDDLNITADHLQYISKTKVENLLAKKSLTKEETIVGLKLKLANSKDNKNEDKLKQFLLKDISFFGNEYKTLNLLKVRKNIENSTPKDKNNTIFCTHQALLDTPEAFSNKKLILLNTEEFLKTLHFHTSQNLHLDNAMEIIEALQSIHPKNQTLKSLESKLTMFFGMVGIFFNKYNDKNQYASRAYVKHFTTQLQEFKVLQENIKDLIETSKELGEIKNEETSELLTDWKEYLKNLHRAIVQVDETKDFTYIETNYFGQLQICTFKKSYTSAVNKIFKQFKNFALTSIDIDEKNTGSYILKRLGIEDPVKQIKTNQKNANLKIIVKKNAKISSNDLISNFIKENKGSTAVIFSSKKSLESHTLSLKAQIEAENLKFISLYANSLGKTEIKMQKFQKSGEDKVLFISKHYWNNFKYKNQFDNLIVLRLPFIPPTDPLTIMQSMHFKNGFGEYSLPGTITAMKEIILGLDQTRAKIVLLADMRLSTKKYGLEIAEALEDIGMIE